MKIYKSSTCRVIMKVTKSNVLFETTGRVDYAYDGYIGLNSDMVVSGGYDGHVPASGPELTIEERKELADYMIALWKVFRGDV